MNDVTDLYDVLLVGDQFKRLQYPTFEQNQEVFLESNHLKNQTNEIKKKIRKQENTQNTFCNQMCISQFRKKSQSRLHNCPKYLIKQIIQSLGLATVNILSLPEFVQLQEQIKASIKNLIGILELSIKGKIKYFSKELLKLVYEQGSQNNSKAKLMQLIPIKRLIMSCNPHTMRQAKYRLRLFTIKRLQQTRSNFIENNHSIRKIINQRYLQIFLQQLISGKVSERVSKSDKEWILQQRIFEGMILKQTPTSNE